MILVIDVGNSNTVYGLYDGDKLIYYWRMTTNRQGTSDEIGLFIVNILEYESIDIQKIEAVVIGSVVPQIMYSLKHAIRKYLHIKPFIVKHDVKTGIEIKYHNPKELGIDRLLNAVAAYELYGGPIIILDLGTATKVCAVSEKGEYLGGAICPGIKISVEALFEATSKLPRVKLEKPSNVICRNTIQGIQSGIIYGHEGMIKFMIEAMKKELNYETVKVVATGGLASLISMNDCLIDEINKNLTLEGLRITYEKNMQ
ncbi:type III pantothenate kinase [Wukongibacter sp. M2B1]|uniref:type III pantothenate kinase n=1 Tax=Wukongibacter sp. M2B1 TaxID=3088895 RepID=UPI003D7A4F10